MRMLGIDKTKDVIAQVGQQMKAIVKPKDYEKTATRTKDLRWQNNTQFDL